MSWAQVPPEATSWEKIAVFRHNTIPHDTIRYITQYNTQITDNTIQENSNELKYKMISQGGGGLEHARIAAALQALVALSCLMTKHACTCACVLN